jgi:hypothetical protein
MAGAGTTQTASRHGALELHPKVAAASLGSLVGTIGVWLLSLTGVNPPQEVAVAITGLISAALAYFAPWMAEGLPSEGAVSRHEEAPVTPISRAAPAPAS